MFNGTKLCIAKPYANFLHCKHYMYPISALCVCLTAGCTQRRAERPQCGADRTVRFICFHIKPLMQSCGPVYLHFWNKLK